MSIKEGELKFYRQEEKDVEAHLPTLNKIYKVALIENGQEVLFSRDDYGQLFILQIGDHRLNHPCPVSSEEYYEAMEFRGENKGAPYIGIVRRKEKDYPHFISEDWEIRGALRRMGFVVV